MQSNIYSLTLSEAIKSEIKNDIDKNFEEALKSPLNKKLMNKNFKYINIGLTFLGIILIFFGIFFFIKNSRNFNITPIKIPFLIIGAVFLVLSIILFSVRWNFVNKIRKNIKNDILKFWKMLEKDNRNWEFQSIGKNFTIMPEQKFVKYGLNNYNNFRRSSNQRWIEIVLSGRVEDNLFNLGSEIEKIVIKDKDDKTESVTYNRYLYYVQEIKNDFNTKIVPENMISKFLSKFKNEAKLESIEFEKVFHLDYSDPIALRKLLTPKVMNKMIESSKNSAIPCIFLSNNKITILYYFPDVSQSGGTGTICKIPFAANSQKFYANVINMFEKDLASLLLCKNWVSNFDFAS